MKIREVEGGTGSTHDEKEVEREMMDAVKRTLKLSKEVPGGEHPATGIDVRNGAPYGSHQKDALAVYPAEGDDTDKLYLRTMKTGGKINGGRSIRAYTGKERSGRREGQYVQVTTDYESKPDKEFDRPKGSTTTVDVYDKKGNLIRQREHKSDSVGLSPLVTKIVTKGIDNQIKKIKDIDNPPTLF